MRQATAHLPHVHWRITASAHAAPPALPATCKGALIHPAIGVDSRAIAMRHAAQHLALIHHAQGCSAIPSRGSSSGSGRGSSRSSSSARGAQDCGCRVHWLHWGGRGVGVVVAPAPAITAAGAPWGAPPPSHAPHATPPLFHLLPILPHAAAPGALALGVGGRVTQEAARRASPPLPGSPSLSSGGSSSRGSAGSAGRARARACLLALLLLIIGHAGLYAHAAAGPAV